MPSIPSLVYNTAPTSNITSYPQSQLNRSGYFITMFDTVALPYNKKYDNCKNTLCYTHSKGTFVYKPHSETGAIGTSAASYLARRNRI